MSSEEPDWRHLLVSRITERNKRESSNHKQIIQQNNRLLDSVSQLKTEKFRLSVENEQLRSAVATGGGGRNSGAGNIAVAALEKKLLAQQEELTDLHKRKGENSQLIVDLNVRAERQSRVLAERDQSLAEQISLNHSLKAEVQMFKSSLDELKKMNTTLKDEHTALLLAFSGLEEKLRSVQAENFTLLERLMRYKTKDADKLNEENESFLKKRSDKVRRDLEDAVRDTTATRNSTSPVSLGGPDQPVDGIGGGDNGGGGDHPSDERFGAPTNMTGFYSTSNPSTIHLKFEAHDGEVNAVRWSPVERVVATGGADRKVKLWDVGKASLEPRAVLGGSNAGINSVDFDSTGSYVLGTSNDFGARIWTVADNRLRHTLTGHSGKVMAAKYLQEPAKVVTGSHDRTLKIWDLRSIACIETKFVGSSCNDLVTTDSLGSTIISGHVDKKIRFWDIRTDKSANDIVMPARITSLDLSKDCNYLLCSVRDDTIKLLDLRMNQIVGSFEHENFKLSCDWARVGFNFNGTRVACGSADGSIFIWNVNGKWEATLKGHSPSAVNAVAWNPTSSALASVGKGRRCIVWVDA